MLDLGGADAVGEGAEGAVGRSVAVAADDRHARQGESLFRPDDVDDALPHVGFVVIFDAEFGCVLRQRLDLNAAFLVFDAEMAIRRSGHVVVDDGERPFRVADLAGGHAKSLKGLRARHLMDEVTVDPEQDGAVFLAIDDVVVENLVVERAGCVGHFGVPSRD